MTNVTDRSTPAQPVPPNLRRAFAYPAPAAYTLPDAVAAMKTAAGLSAATGATLARYNAETGGPSVTAVDIADALRIARKATGIDPNP